ncbi:hypothetical protein JIG36_25580 [Actinoplanes sp. LDG1-06]|uniref:Uncharacterized protein n=1 Tax=Paractinoplanes ovalisporus TaxID=2810368 RepID=A0ABS2AGL5_9ACTN|nr:hypothetical protein [Actinoplanes ovalisporus]MBM2618935.1 hypothetical protein [Actinoplanes ovalisporus]
MATFDVKDDEGEATTEGPGSVIQRHVDVIDLAQIEAGVAFAVVPIHVLRSRRPPRILSRRSDIAMYQAKRAG